MSDDLPQAEAFNPCGECGESNSPQSNFCRHCGYAMRENADQRSAIRRMRGKAGYDENDEKTSEGIGMEEALAFMARNEPDTDADETKSFQVADDAGLGWARIAAGPKAASMHLYRKERASELLARVTQDFASLSLSVGEDGFQIGACATPNGVNITLSDVNGRSRAKLEVANSGSPSLRFFDEDEHEIWHAP